MEEAVKDPKVKSAKLKFKAPDLSKINLRKVNWNTVMAVLAYLHILVIIPMIYGRKSPFVQFHTKQGFALLFVWVLFAYSMYLPIIPLVFAWYLAVAIIGGIISVIQGREKSLLFTGSVKRMAEDVSGSRKEDFGGEIRKVNWVVALIMSILFGQFGIDRFVMGDITGGLGKLFLGIVAMFSAYYNFFKIIAVGQGNTFFPGLLSIIFLIWWFSDIVRIASKSKFQGVEWV